MTLTVLTMVLASTLVPLVAFGLVIVRVAFQRCECGHAAWRHGFTSGCSRCECFNHWMV